jgi:hypothetical protein
MIVNINNYFSGIAGKEVSYVIKIDPTNKSKDKTLEFGLRNYVISTFDCPHQSPLSRPLAAL